MTAKIGSAEMNLQGERPLSQGARSLRALDPLPLLVVLSEQKN